VSALIPESVMPASTLSLSPSASIFWPPIPSQPPNASLPWPIRYIAMQFSRLEAFLGAGLTDSGKSVDYHPEAVQQATGSWWFSRW